MKTTKLMALLMAVIMLLSCLVGCSTPSDSKTTEASNKQTTGAETTEAGDTGITFPLEEQVTFTIGYRSAASYGPEVLESVPFWKELQEKTNVKIELVQLPVDETMTKLNTMFMSNKEPDAIFCSFMKDNNIDELSANGLLLPLTEYVKDPEIMPNFNERVLAESPQTAGVITSPDGEIYALPRYDALEGSFLESPMWINKNWLDQLGMKIPTTIEELEAALIAFRDNDMNGNGVDDEIPLFVTSKHSYCHFESLLGLWGIPTKNGTYENYTYVVDGEVKFAPTSQGFKDAIVQLNDWYENKLIWQEAFTYTSETFQAKLNGTEAVVGVFMNNNLTAAQVEQGYVLLEPVAVEGYEPSWYVHPGLMGVKSQFVVTRSCENVDILMKWIDQLYTLENFYRGSYGEISDGRYSIENGVYTMNEKLQADANAWAELDKTNPAMRTVTAHFPWAITAKDYAEGKIKYTDAQIRLQDNYEAYRPYLNDELWPRPYMSAETTNRLAELRTDIFSTVNEKKAAWITGTADINADWDNYVKSLEKMDLAEFMKLMQDAYDTYMAGQ